MNHSTPIPLPDELAQGLLGRLARLNGLPSTAWANKSLRAGQPQSGDTPLLWLMATAQGLSEADFSAKHSMLPVLHPISRYMDSAQDIGRKRRVAQIQGMSLPTHQLRWCPQCARLDTENRGFSHWRRLHQIAGVDWCIEHREPLVCAPLEAAIHAPGHPTTHGPLCATPANIEEESRHSALLRLQQVMVGWLHRPNPIRLSAWTQVVGEQCRKSGLRIGEIGKRPVVSDRIREMFPTSWLARHMPEIASKAARSFVRKVDGACIDKHVAYPALACAMILTVLFDSAGEALGSLETADRRLATLRPAGNASGEALTAFLAGLGLQAACEKFGASVASVEAALRQELQQQLQPTEPTLALIP